MVEARIYSVIVNNGNQHKFYGIFSNRKNMLNSIVKNLDITDAYIQGSHKKLKITPVNVSNNFDGNGLTIVKGNTWYIKILMHNMNIINPYF